MHTDHGNKLDWAISDCPHCSRLVFWGIGTLQVPPPKRPRLLLPLFLLKTTLGWFPCRSFPKIFLPATWMNRAG